jgi:hypothetical protein
MKLPLMGGVGPAAETSSHQTPPSSSESCANHPFAPGHRIGGLVDIEPFHVAAYIKALKVSDAGNPAR